MIRKMPDRETEPPGTYFDNINKVKLFLNVILILFAFLACYAEDIYLFYRPPQPGQTALMTVRSQTAFDFDQQKVFGSLRNAAIARHIPIYVYDPDRVAAAREKLAAFSDEVLQDRSKGTAGRADLVRYVKGEFGVRISWEDATRLLRYPDLKHLLSGLLAIQNTISQSKIVEDAQPLHDKMTVQVLYPKPVGTSILPVAEITTLEKARQNLQKRVQEVFFEVDPHILDPILQILAKTLQPNLYYNQKDNSRGIEDITQQFPSKILPYRPGDVLVPFLKVMDDMDVPLLKTSQEAEKKEMYGQIPLNLFVICFSVLLYNLLLSTLFSPCWHGEPPYQLFIFVLILTIFLAKVSLLFTALPVYIIPFTLLPLLLAVLHRERISITMATILGALLISLFSGRDLGIFLFLTFGGLVALLTSFEIRRRSQILVSSLAVGITNAVVIVLLFAVSHSTLSTLLGELRPLLTYMGWGFVGGLAAGLLVLLFLPLMELSRHYTSPFELAKFSDLQQPLLVELLTKAPGTYQHVMSVGHYAYVLGEAIGANSLLLRVGAYYHDIGKIENPEFFVENLFGKKSPHDALPPKESAKIIMEHVKRGKKIAQEAGLPEVVVDFIPQHHGTRLIEFFYDKALKENPEGKVNEKDFRYSGPKPQSVEAAIIMIVDGVEATSRTMEEPTREKIENMIYHIIMNRLTDGQFDECNLSTREIATIVTVLVRAMEASFHTRVEYPWQQQESAEKKSKEKQVENKENTQQVPA